MSKKKAYEAMNNNDVCQTLTLWEGNKEIYKKLSIMVVLQPEIIALMIKLGKKHIDSGTY